MQFVLGYDLAEFAGTLQAIAEGEIDVVAAHHRPRWGSTALPSPSRSSATPSAHCKILVTP